MMYSKRKELFYREFLLLAMGLFIALALVESNTFHVVLRRPSELLTLTFYYGIFYLILLAIRIAYCAARNFVRVIMSWYHKKGENKGMIPIISPPALPSWTSRLKEYAHTGVKALKPVYALHKIRSLF
ncbi:MAG: hypothetical protein ACMUIS_02335 [bacterium]